ncbi:hypothetical protein [Taibaiella chishuiensis]|uniref:hypothetical protein n=1 Tax=Taibaiella chishuiensis TaxID=1434707 RepID=UPI000D0D1849|nr:hypothetical protein [Taibaiella chishuiensis]
MQQKRTLSFVFIIIAIIIGAALYRNFDFQNSRFKKPALAAVYLVTLAISMGFIFGKKKTQNN